jgi:DNA-binding NarL/FixJ family response regulator
MSSSNTPTSDGSIPNTGEPPHDPPRVVIVEDHELLAQSLSFALRAEGFVAQRVFADSHDEILREVEHLGPQVTLLDLDLGDSLGSSTPLIPRLCALPTQVVMVTGVTDRVRLAEAVEAGATGLVSKEQPFDALVTAVRDAVALGSLLTQSQREALLDELRRQRREEAQRLADFHRLTAREQAVLAGLIDGKAPREIADDAVVSLDTVRSQIKSLLAKLHVHSQLGAVALARRAGWEPDGQ